MTEYSFYYKVNKRRSIELGGFFLVTILSSEKIFHVLLVILVLFTSNLRRKKCWHLGLKNITKIRKKQLQN